MSMLPSSQPRLTNSAKSVWTPAMTAARSLLSFVPISLSWCLYGSQRNAVKPFFIISKSEFIQNRTSGGGFQ